MRRYAQQKCKYGELPEDNNWLNPANIQPFKTDEFDI